jgi:hypothetical protein
MPIVLWLLGSVTTVAGLLLVASAFGLRDGTFDSEVLTPGMVGVVGGLLLIGLGIAVREMRRIERALATRSTPRSEKVIQPLAAADLDAATAATAPVSTVEPKPATAPDTAAAAVVEEDAALERLRAKFPTLVGRSNGAAGQEIGAQAATVRVEVEDAIAAEIKGATAATAAANGRAQEARLLRRPAGKAHSAAVAPARTNGSALSTFWPVNPRRHDNQTAAVEQVSPSAAPGVVAETPSVSNPTRADESAKVANSETQPSVTSPVTVLKSGIVEGMAYTLFSDGSIEADLPQGTLRFGSIGALREHIEGAVQ